MQKYIIILANYEGETDYNNPMELMGADKNDIKKAISDNVPPELIRHIFTVQEYKTFLNSKNNKTNELNYNNDISGTDYLNMALEEAKQTAHANAIISGESRNESGYSEFNTNGVLKPDSVQTSETADIVTNNKLVDAQTNYLLSEKPSETFFTDNGVTYKLCNGKLFKKVWQTITPDDSDYTEFRVISNKTQKIASSEIYSVQKLVFVPIETN
jgi:hypothetical protein